MADYLTRQRVIAGVLAAIILILLIVSLVLVGGGDDVATSETNTQSTVEDQPDVTQEVQSDFDEVLGSATTIESDQTDPAAETIPTPNPVVGVRSNGIPGVRQAEHGATIEAGTSCTTEVSPGQDPNTAINSAKPGDTICINPGNYGLFVIDNVNGTEAAPITIRASDLSNKPVFTLGDYTQGGRGTVTVDDSTNLALVGLEVTNAMKGIGITNSQNILVESCVVHNLGQEAIHAQDGSEAITIRGCDVSKTGQRPGHDENLNYSVYGELVYIGAGSGLGELTRNVLIEGNTLHDNQATAEAINTKPNAADVTIQFNHIYGISSWCEAAVSIQGTKNVTTISNVVHDITSGGYDSPGTSGWNCRNAEAIRYRGGATGTIENNIIFNAQLVGIHVHDGAQATVSNNTVFGNGTDFKLEAGAKSENNASSDGTDGQRISATDLAGDATATADAGSGPGSALALQIQAGSSLYSG